MKNLLAGTMTYFIAVSSWACADEATAQSSLVEAFSQKVSQSCKLVQKDEQSKILTVLCAEQNRFSLSYKDGEVFALIYSQRNYRGLHQCFFTGVITANCEASLQPMVCQSINLD